MFSKSEGEGTLLVRDEISHEILKREVKKIGLPFSPGMVEAPPLALASCYF